MKQFHATFNLILTILILRVQLDQQFGSSIVPQVLVDENAAVGRLFDLQIAHDVTWSDTRAPNHHAALDLLAIVQHYTVLTHFLHNGVRANVHTS